LNNLAIITTHPIQYNAPLFQLLTKEKELQIKIFYTWEQSMDKFFDPGFAKEIQWDIPLLSGYDYTFVKNTSRKTNRKSFFRIKNPSLIPEIVQWKADAILIFGWNYYSHMQCMRYFKGKIPVYFRGDSTLLDEQIGIKKLIRRFFLRWVYSHIDYALYTGTNNKAYYIAHCLIEKQLIFTPHAIDNQRFKDTNNLFQKQAEEWKQKLGIKTNHLVFLFAGKFEKVKNPEIIIKAAQIIQDECIQYIFVGDGYYKPVMKNLSKGLNNIHFIPFQNQTLMPIVYHLGDVFILCSLSETWGLAINEAMVCRKPVIASNKCGCAVDLIQHGKNGYIFDAGNIQDLIQCMQNFKNLSKEEFQNFGMKSASIIENWNYKATIQYFVKHLKEHTKR
jgi:glycosyltransferase involved in cell wall biosynthesis